MLKSQKKPKPVRTDDSNSKSIRFRKRVQQDKETEKELKDFDGSTDNPMPDMGWRKE